MSSNHIWRIVLIVVAAVVLFLVAAIAINAQCRNCQQPRPRTRVTRQARPQAQAQVTPRQPQCDLNARVTWRYCAPGQTPEPRGTATPVEGE